MTLLEALCLALVQGVLEFLPISSSAHLILLPYILGWTPHDLRFDIVTNAGTLAAAVLYFRREIAAGLASALNRGFGLLAALAVGTVPVVVAGLAFYDFFSTTARRPEIIAAASIFFGLVLYAADRLATRRRELADLGWRDSVVVGLAQALALVPGTSRSGITLTAGLALGFTREAAARFSFLLAIPVGVLALAKDALDAVTEGIEPGGWLPLAVGFAVSFVAAYLTIGWILAWLERRSLTVFVVYRIALGLLILALVFFRG